MSVTISINHAKKIYPNGNEVISDLNATIMPGEFFTLLGPSGCGKTTLLRMIAGFNTIEGGEIKFNEKVINDLPPYKRNVGMVFQNYAVFPHMTAKENVAFGLKERKIKEPELSNRVNEMLKKVQIEELADREPANMSGGQQQRIALARAIVINPDVLLFDEPLSNLDAKLRVDMRSVIRHIQKQAGITTVYVTHDQEEALAISDRIAVMNKGEIQQIASPIVIYRKPYNLFVATFMGQTNIIDCKCHNKVLKVNGSNIDFKFDRIKDDFNEEDVKLCVRPNEFFFDENGIEATITERIFFGINTHYYADTVVGNLLISCDVNDKLYEVGDKVHLNIPTRVCNVFENKENGMSIMGDLE